MLEQTRKVEALKGGLPAFGTRRRLAMRFIANVRGGKADKLPAWTCEAIETNLTLLIFTQK